MENELQNAIDVLVKRIEMKTTELNNAKRMVNELCKDAGQEAIYSDSDISMLSGAGIASVKPDAFYGKSPTTAAREYLALRGQAAGLDEIFEGLIRGGFDFNALGWNDEGRRRNNLSISISKNTAIFHRLPNDMIGLTKWYPDLKKKAGKTADKSDDDKPEENGENGDATSETKETLLPLETEKTD